MINKKKSVEQEIADGINRYVLRNEPEPGKQYRLTGGPGVAAISNGNTWAESKVEKVDEKKIKIQGIEISEDEAEMARSAGLESFLYEE